MHLGNVLDLVLDNWDIDATRLLFEYGGSFSRSEDICRDDIVEDACSMQALNGGGQIRSLSDSLSVVRMLLLL